MNWWVLLALLLLAGSLLGGSGEVALGMVRGEIEIVSGSVDLAKNWAAGFYHWDRIGVNALADTSGAVAKLTVGVVCLVYLMMTRLFYKVTWHVWDFFRRKPMVSKTRVKIMCFGIAICAMAVFTWGFEFPRALVGAFL